MPPPGPRLTSRSAWPAVARNSQRTGKRGFSLVELLAVMAIIAILTVTTLLAIPGLVTSYDLSTSANAFSSQLDLARQQAATLNVAVEVRFYRYVIAGFPGEPAQGNFHAYQLIENGQPLDRVETLAGRIIFAAPSTTTMSPLLDSTPSTTTAPTASIPAGTTYVSLFFRPNGTVFQPTGATGTLTPITATDNYLTMIDGAGNQAAPVNYVTFIIDPVSGTCKAVHP